MVGRHHQDGDVVAVGRGMKAANEFDAVQDGIVIDHDEVGFVGLTPREPSCGSMKAQVRSRGVCRPGLCIKVRFSGVSSTMTIFMVLAVPHDGVKVLSALGPVKLRTLCLSPGD